MKKQYFYILFLCFLFPSIVFSQTDDFEKNNEITSNRSHNEIGFNLGYLITNLIRNEIPPTNFNDRNYLLSFKKFKQNNNYVRFGLSFDYRKPQNDNSSNQSLRGDFRIGYEHQILIYKDKFQINPGFDVALTYFQNRISSNFQQSSTKQEFIQIGPIPFVGFQYNLNPRIHLSTEFGFAFFFTERKNFFTATGFADGEGINILFQMPQEFILSVSF